VRVHRDCFNPRNLVVHTVVSAFTTTSHTTT
jgi:hypothetical protein